ncbi:hypothetical protein [Miniphocaeibacter massiliensis]|uniref:hypothetical protein n=1 Tax=Miniphocaeibacter massiliensis TaxID=2041841 RepID=UPI000C078533|nr:hypothetical protein [Miniphocaeibacter massiliensis]
MKKEEKSHSFKNVYSITLGYTVTFLILQLFIYKNKNFTNIILTAVTYLIVSALIYFLLNKSFKPITSKKFTLYIAIFILVFSILILPLEF